ncbi:MAG: N-acetyltransferase family protein [Chloroflexota bacterium]
MVETVIDRMQPGDWDEVRSIYLEGIATGNATFETNPPDWDAWDSAHLPFCRLVAREGKSVIGWAALSPVSDRCIYSGVAEVSLYVTASAWGRGIGRSLLIRLIDESEQNGIWTLQAGIFPENRASLAVHKKCGFREVGIREGIGKLNSVWRDVVLLERRSEKVGID